MDAMAECQVVGVVEREGNTSHPHAALASWQPGAHAGAGARRRHKTNRLAPDALLAHDVTFACHFRGVMAMDRRVPGLIRATSGAEPR